VCDERTSEVLTLGADLGVRPSRVEDSTTQGEQAAATLTFADAEARAIAEYTGAHVGDRLAVTDGLVLVTAPTIQSAITAGAIVISGGFSASQAHAMVGRLRLATLGARIEVRS
jgi:preprotein translocase subunit SecD